MVSFSKMLFGQSLRMGRWSDSQRATGLSNGFQYGARDRQELTDLLAKRVSLAFLERLVKSAQSQIRWIGQGPPDLLGLMAIAAYTSGGLDRLLREGLYQVKIENLSPSAQRQRAELIRLEQLIQYTIAQLGKTTVCQVRRNMVLSAQQIWQWQSQQQIRFERITSVTFQPHQVYSGGNVDLILRPKQGVADVSMLSVYSGHSQVHLNRAEQEGLLDHNACFRVVRSQPGLENGRVSPVVGRDHPAMTLLLEQIED